MSFLIAANESKPALRGAWLLLAGICYFAPVASAQELPPAGESNQYMPPPPLEYSPGTVEALARAQEWIGAEVRPSRGFEGEVVFNFGESLPTVICAPLYPCTIQLQPGEIVRQFDIGDLIRWHVTPSQFGSGPEQTTVLVVKPTDIDIHTVLFVATDRRLYSIRLSSSETDWMPRVGFAYTESVGNRWRAYFAAQQEEQNQEVLDDGNLIDELDFNFDISGDADWKPIRIYRSGKGTTIQFPAPISQIPNPPVLSLVDRAEKGDQQIVNYRIEGDRFVLTRPFAEAILSDGKNTVTITHRASSSAND